MSRRRDMEESIYELGRAAPAAGGPKVKTYNVPAPAAGPKVKMHADSSQVESILNPVRGIRDAQARAGITPTNHSRHNILAIKEQSRLNALQKMQEAEDAQLAQQQQFKPQMRRTTSGGASSSMSRSLSGGGGRAGASAVAAAGARPGIGRSNSSNAAAARLGSAGGSRDSSGGGSRNFVEENKAAAAAASRPVKAEGRQDEGAAYLQKSEYGQVPSYLMERKMQMAQEHEALMEAKKAALIPPGLRQMPDAERRATLQVLESNKAEVEARLAALPIIIETPSMIRHKDELERRLREIEDAHKIFSRPNVLVHATQP